MKNTSGVIRYISVCAICVLTFIAALYNNFYKNGFIPVRAEVQIEAPSKYEKDEQTIEQPTLSEEKKSESSEKKESTPASSTGVYKGKIIKRYISPYSASTSYNKVYIKNVSSNEINIKKLLNSELSFKIKKSDDVQVLILHTHTTETYMREESDVYTDDFTPRTRNKQYNMVKIGEIVAKKLNDAGIKTVHAKVEHDYPEYTGSYSRAASTINKYLKKHPSIKVVLDLHRDAISSGESDKVKLVTEIGGKKAAQVMLVMGSRASTHPNWQENLKLAVRLQKQLEEDYPTLARPLYLTSKSYNQGLSKGAMLIEFGTDGNTIDEACLSAEYVGNSLVKVLKSLE